MVVELTEIGYPGIYAPIISRVLGRPVKPSYSFMGLYYNEADLKPHRDNTQVGPLRRCNRTIKLNSTMCCLQCEYTLSIQTDFRPADTKYPIYICEVRKHSGQYWQESCSGNETEISAEVTYRPIPAVATRLPSPSLTCHRS